MDADFWHDRWQTDRIGFHQDAVSPMLAAHWDACAVPADARVFVPLCGKSLDMVWLADRGHRVLGVELSPIAVDGFFAALGQTPQVHDSAHGRHHVSGPYELILGDAFALDAALLSGCAGVFDRAALIALPPALRTRYMGALYPCLPIGCRGLLVTIEYPQAEMAGPPFSVREDEVRGALAGRWQVDLLERRDVLAQEPRFIDEGVSALDSSAYRITRR